MEITLTLNGKTVKDNIDADLTLLDFLRKHGCKSVRQGCESSNCGICTVFFNHKPILSCSVLALKADGQNITTLEGLQDEAQEFGRFVAERGAEQCGFCNPGMVMNAIALFREIENPTDEQIKEYLAGNLCRCTGYEGQMDAIKNFIEWRKSNKDKSVI